MGLPHLVDFRLAVSKTFSTYYKVRLKSFSHCAPKLAANTKPPKLQNDRIVSEISYFAKHYFVVTDPVVAAGTVSVNFVTTFAERITDSAAEIS